MTFSELPISAATRTALAGMQIAEPTPIQAQTLPALLAGKDVIGQARTGSGKTLAFAIPMVERVRAGAGAAQALVLTPTRELASQVASVVAAIGRGHKLRVAELVGGRGFEPQANALRGGAEVVVGTPGRVLDHLKQRTLTFNALTYVVLDEADEMLDKGFGPDVERILGFIPKPAGAGRRQQHALFSATLPEWARAIAAKLLVNPVVVRVDDGKPAGVAPETVDHVVYDLPEGAKPAVLRALLNEDHELGSATLVFGRTKHGVKKLAKQLEREGYSVGALQANLSQNARDRVIAAFRSGEIPVLVATNVAARGIDVAELGRVINYDLPENGALFTHRVGRTGRMGRAGQAITLLTPEDKDTWRRLERELKAAGLQGSFPRRPWSGPLPAVPEPAPAEPRPAQPARRVAGRPESLSSRPASTKQPVRREGTNGVEARHHPSSGRVPAPLRDERPVHNGASLRERPSFDERLVRAEAPTTSQPARRIGWASRQRDHAVTHAVAARAPQHNPAVPAARPSGGRGEQTTTGAGASAAGSPNRNRRRWRGYGRPTSPSVARPA